MPVVKILPASRRNCDENLCRRMWASAYYRQPVNKLRYLLSVLDSPRPLYRRIGEKALATNDAKEMAEACATLETEIERLRTEHAKRHEAMPLLYPKAA
jgi:uncharacterized small protein (DUF1192 family)